MIKPTQKTVAAFASASLLSLAMPAFGAAQRTFVASYGLDTNPCSVTQPCRGFAAALLLTNTGGEIIVLDSAGYGSVTINKAVSIIAPAGAYAGVTNGSGDGIVVNAPGAHVVLRGLDINGLGTSTGSGILHVAAASLLIDRCTVAGFANTAGPGPTGISIQAGPATIANSEVRNNSRGGIAVRGTDPGNPLRVTIVKTQIIGNGSISGAPEDAGLTVLGGALVTVKDSVARGNFRGYSACGRGAPEPAGAALSIESSLSDGNAVGIFVGVNAVACALRISNSTITNNSLFGIEQQGGAVVTSLGTNFVYANAAAETFGLTGSPK